MKSISILVPTIDSGGAEKQAVLLSTTLSSYYSVNLIVLFGDHIEYSVHVEFLSKSSVSVYKLRGNIVSKVIRLRSILKKTDTSVLFNYLSLPDLIGSFVGRSLHIRTYNGIRTTRLSALKERLEKIAHNLVATGSIFNCYSGVNYFCSRGYSKKKSIVIPNCFPNISDIRERGDKEIKTIITVGRFDEAKDYKTLIKSVSLLQRNDFQLCIIGYGILEEQIREWVNEFNLEKKTNIHIKPYNVSELVCNADIYLSTSLFEGTSNSIMEALNWSLPVVATNVGDNDHLVIEGENGFLHPVGDVDGLSFSLCRLLDSVELRNQMGKKSNQNLRKNYSMKAFEKRYIDLIEGNNLR